MEHIYEYFLSRQRSKSVCRNAQIPVGSTLVPVGGDQKLVLETDDYVQVQTTGAAHVITSFVEIT